MLLYLTLIGCKTEKTEKAQKNIETATAENDLAKVPNSWISNRVDNVRKKLMTSEAGKIVWDAMEAHGGLDRWYSNGPIAFQFNYQPLDGGTPRNTYQMVDTWRSRARHRSVSDPEQQYGWDGEQAWLKAKDSTVFAYNTRFWSLTPYFFMAQPFVLAGEGTNLQLLEQIDFEDKMHDVVKVTFDSGTGDAPDDYYILYFDTRSRKLAVIRYIVSYPGYFKDGGHLPEKFMELTGEQTVEGISFPKRYKTYWLTDENKPGEHITDIELSEIEFLPGLKNSYFEVPAGAEVLEGL